MTSLYQCSLVVDGELESIIAFQYKVMDEKNHLNFTNIVRNVDHWEVGMVENVVLNFQGLLYYFSLNGKPSTMFLKKASKMFPSLTFTLKYEIKSNPSEFETMVMKNGRNIVSYKGRYRADIYDDNELPF